MKVFPKANQMEGWTCPVCKTAEQKPVTLIPVDGTADHGIEECVQVHVDCVNVRYCKDNALFYQHTPVKI